MAVETIGRPGSPCSSLRLSSVSAPNSQRRATPSSNPLWHMMERGEQRFLRLPLGSAPASRRTRATAQCCPTKATKRGVCAFTSRMSTLAPARISSSTQAVWPAGKCGWDMFASNWQCTKKMLWISQSYHNENSSDVCSQPHIFTIYPTPRPNRQSEIAEKNKQSTTVRIRGRSPNFF